MISWKQFANLQIFQSVLFEKTAKLTLTKADSSEVAYTTDELASLLNPSVRPVNITGDTTLTQQHNSKILAVNAAAGATLTLPDATGSGVRMDIIVGTTVTSNNLVVQAANGDDILVGLALLAQDSVDTIVAFETASDTDTITLDGSTQGGIAGDKIELIDFASNKWHVKLTGSATGTEATPFSAAVS